MTKDAITKIVGSYISQSLEGQEAENPKYDFKAHWYDLSTQPGINEFIKDTSAMANTFGLDGLIVIGFDDKKKLFFDSTFSNSNMSDSAMVGTLINKKVNRMFEVNIFDILFQNHKLSIIHIPPSLDKPHVITNYQTFEKDGNFKREEQQRVFVRKGTGTGPATKNDLELMYYDRKNIIPEYKILSSFHISALDIRLPRHDVEYDGNFNGLISISFENLGRRPVAIIEVKLTVSHFTDPDDYKKIDFISDGVYKVSNIVVQPNEMLNKSISLICKHPIKIREEMISLIDQIRSSRPRIIVSNFSLRLSNGSILQSELIQINS